MKELIINKPSELLTITNRNTYTSLTLNCEVNPKLLYGFNNIKELTINNKNKGSVENHLNEVNINKLPFIEKLEKINFKNIKTFGQKEQKKKKGSYRTKYDYYDLKAPNLKSITFIYDKKSYGITIYDSYLKECNKLEEINVESTVGISKNYGLYLPKNMKSITFKFLGKEYTINLLEDELNIDYFSLNSDDKKVYLKYNNNIGAFYSETDLITDEIKKENVLTVLNDSLIKDNTLCIPHYITRVSYNNINYLNKIEHISFNIDLLKHKNDLFTISDNKYLNLIKTIELKTNKEMSLFPSIKIDTSNYGIVQELYIKNTKLYIGFKDYKLVVNEDGIISKEEYEEEIEEELTEEIVNETCINLDDYSIGELEEYLQYRKLLETYKDNEDEELTNAINVLGDRIIKKLTK